jgi:asparagine synthase (glutamine-hydrolysing)
LEIRTPLADIEVVRAVAAISARSRPRKHDLAELPSKPLPQAILERSKTGFAVPVREWISATDGESIGRGLRGWAMRLTREFNFELRERPRLRTPSLSTSYLA